MTEKKKEDKNRVRQDQAPQVESAEELVELMKNWCVPGY